MYFRSLTVIAILLCFTQVFAGALSFREWKGRRVEEAKSLVGQVKRDKSLSADQKISKLEKAQTNLETARDLTANDFFHLYLMERMKDNPDEIRKVAKKLSKEELADILIGYIEQTNQLNTGGAPLPMIQVSPAHTAQRD